MQLQPIAVVGAGSWGTALTLLLSRKGFPVRLWIYEPELIWIIKEKHENSYYLPGYRIPEIVTPSHSFEETLQDVSMIFWVTPSHTIRQTLLQALPFISPGSIFIGASKGIENDTLLRVSQIVEHVVPQNVSLRYLTLSGPTFATEVANGQPTTAVVAGKDEQAARIVQSTLNTNSFRVYINQDHIGVELGGALKNIIAIAAGITKGIGLGSNSRAALITRGLWEMTRLGKAAGADPMTFLGLAGIGDLVLTCDGTESRNFKTGYRIGQGESVEEIQQSMRMVAEGVKTTKSVRELAKKLSVEMPITEQVYQVLYHRKSPHDAVRELMTRSLKSEHQMEYMIPEE